MEMVQADMVKRDRENVGVRHKERLDKVNVEYFIQHIIKKVKYI